MSVFVSTMPNGVARSSIWQADLLKCNCDSRVMTAKSRSCDKQHEPVTADLMWSRSQSGTAGGLNSCWSRQLLIILAYDKWQNDPCKLAINICSNFLYKKVGRNAKTRCVCVSGEIMWCKSWLYGLQYRYFCDLQNKMCQVVDHWQPYRIVCFFPLFTKYNLTIWRLAPYGRKCMHGATTPFRNVMMAN